MYIGKSVASRMDPWRTPALPGYSCENLPSRTTWKEEIRPNVWSEIP